MPTPQRTVFEGFQTTWLVPLFYAVAAVAIAVFLYGVYRRVRRYRSGRPRPLARGWPVRIATALWEVLTSKRVGRRDPYTGIAHGLVFWAFGFLFLGTVTIAIDHDVLGILAPRLEFWKGAFFLGFSVVMDVSAAMFLVGLGMLAIRRAFFHVRRLSYARVDGKPTDRSAYEREDWWFLGQLFAIGLTGVFLEAFRLLHDHPWFEAYSPVGLALAHGLRAVGVSAAAAGTWHFVIWWGHAFLALTFIAYLPYAKSVHMLAAWANGAVRDDKAAIRLEPPPAQGPPHIPRTPAPVDLAWTQLLAVDACTRCGRCHDVCPARSSGAPLSPRDLVLDLREFLGGRRGTRLAADGALALTDMATMDVEGTSLIAPEALWSCTTCRACVEACPVGIEHVPIIVGMRRGLVDEGMIDANLQGALMNVARKGNSFGASDRGRAKWVEGAGVAVKDARKEAVEYLWFVGDFASYDPRAQKVSQSVARVLSHLGVDFGILYESERNAGNDVRRVGEEGLFETLVEKNLAALAKAQYRAIVTTDPHSYNTLKNEYPEYGLSAEVMHYTELLDRLAREGRLEVQTPLNVVATYHDPCYLGRYNRVFDPPRDLLRRVGVTLKEMPRNRENSFCCGAGGGRLWSGDSLYREKPAESRIREAAALEGVDTFVVSCPKDMAMYSDAVKTAGYEGKMDVEDVIFLVERALGIGRPEEEEVSR